jgi:hypothetical protein
MTEADDELRQLKAQLSLLKADVTCLMEKVRAGNAEKEDKLLLAAYMAEVKDREAELKQRKFT